MHDFDYVQLTPQRMKGLVAWSRGVFHNQEWTTIKGHRQRRFVALLALYMTLLVVLVFILVLFFLIIIKLFSRIVLILILPQGSSCSWPPPTHRKYFLCQSYKIMQILRCKIKLHKITTKLYINNYLKSPRLYDL